MTVRLARPGDEGEIFALNAEFNGPGNASREEIARALRGEMGGEIVLLALVGDRAAGFACGRVTRSVCYGEPSAEVTEMYVREAYRRRGAARSLLRELLRLFSERGAREIRLLTGGDNRPARALYESAGFRLSGEAHYEMQLTE